MALILCHQCKCQHSKTHTHTHTKVYYYYENFFDPVDALKGSRGPSGSMDHALRTTSYCNIAPDKKTEMKHYLFNLCNLSLQQVFNTVYESECSSYRENIKYWRFYLSLNGTRSHTPSLLHYLLSNF